MTDFIIKSTIALSVFLVFYHLILEKEKIHQFNRFYLLFSIVISLVIPFTSFEIVKEIPVNFSNQISIDPNLVNSYQIVEKTDYKVIVLWAVYGFITLLLAIRFGKNIVELILKSRHNPTVNFKNSKLVLIEEKILPHTFLNYIFVNFDDYKNRNIEAELYTHELVHAAQKHTLDILFVEFLKTIFWYNPIFLLYKKAIQLNHEFLADQEIVNTYNNVPFYQNLLLEKGNGNRTIYLASNLNYLVTKKRLIMMKKRTSKNMAFLKKIAVVPVLVILTTFLCIETVAQEPKTDTKIDTIKNVSDLEKFYSKTTVVFKDEKKNIILQKKYAELTDEQKRRIPPPPPVPLKKSPGINEYADFKNNSKYAVWIDDVNVSNSILDKYEPDDFVYYHNSFVYKNARSKKFPQEHQVNLYTKDGYTKAFDKNQKFGPETITIGAFKSASNKENDLVKKQEGFKISYDTTSVKEPQFSGGIEEFYKFIGNNFKIPAEASKSKVSGKVFMEFMVEKDGSLSEIKVIKDLGYGLGEEAIRVLKLSPKWNPASEKGKPVRVQYSLPITIQTDK